MIEHQILKPSLVIVSDDTPTGEFLKLWEDPAVRGFFEGIEVEVVPGPRRAPAPTCCTRSSVGAGAPSSSTC